MMKIAPILPFALLVYGCSDNSIELARELVVARDSLSWYNDSSAFSLSIRGTLKFANVHFERRIYSPVDRVKFYLFSSRYQDPHIYTVVSSFRDSLAILPTKISFEYVNSDLVLFLNDRLREALPFDASSFRELVLLYNTLTDPGYSFNRILTSWKDIVWASETRAPLEIKESIAPLKVSRDSNGFRAEYYLWEMGSTELSKVLFQYTDRQITIRTELLGKFGEAHVIL